MASRHSASKLTEMIAGYADDLAEKAVIETRTGLARHLMTLAKGPSSEGDLVQLAKDFGADVDFTDPNALAAFRLAATMIGDLDFDY